MLSGTLPLQISLRVGPAVGASAMAVEKEEEEAFEHCNRRLAREMLLGFLKKRFVGEEKSKMGGVSGIL